MTEYLGNTAVIVALDDEPNDEGGLTADQLKAKFDEGLTEFVAWFNDTHIKEVNTNAPGYAADTGSTDDYAIDVSPEITGYEAGQMFCFCANTANTGASTLDVCGLGAVAIKKVSASGLTDTETGDIPAGAIIPVIHNGTYFVAFGMRSVNVGSTEDLPIFTTTGGALAAKTIEQAQTLLGISTGSGMQMQIKTYTGTGTYGSANPTSVTCDFDPDYVLIKEANSTRPFYRLEVLNVSALSGTNIYYSSNATTMQTLKMTYDSGTKTLSWYNTDTALNQLNDNGKNYEVLFMKGGSA